MVESLQYDHYIMWREDFEDEEGWFTKPGAHDLVYRIKQLHGEGEAMIYVVILGKDVSTEFRV